MQSKNNNIVFLAKKNFKSVPITFSKCGSMVKYLTDFVHNLFTSNLNFMQDIQSLFNLNSVKKGKYAIMKLNLEWATAGSLNLSQSQRDILCFYMIPTCKILPMKTSVS